MSISITTGFGGAALGTIFSTTGAGFSHEASFKSGGTTFVSATNFGGSSSLKKDCDDSHANRDRVNKTMTRQYSKKVNFISNPLTFTKISFDF